MRSPICSHTSRILPRYKHSSGDTPPASPRPMEEKTMLSSVLEIVRRSGDIVRQHWDQPRQVYHKGSTDLVTATDLAVEAFLKTELGRLAPKAAFMAEESATSLTEPDGDCWIIDPVDGTTNFVHGIPQVGTSVAFWRDGQVQLGVINLPLLQECFYAVRGGGAWCNGRAIHVSGAVRLQDAVIATGFPYDIPTHMEFILHCLRRLLPATQGIRRIGAASVDLAYVACGRMEGFYEAALKPWDFAAGILLVEEAGGQVSNIQGAPLRFGDILLADNGALHQELLRTLAEGKSSSVK